MYPVLVNANSPRKVYPIWLTVEYASRRLMFVSCNAAQAETNALARAAISSHLCHASGITIPLQNSRANPYSPIFTRIAACSSEVIVDGATPASGNQVWSGTVALLENTPAMMRTRATPPIALPRSSVISKVPYWAYTRAKPSSMKTAPPNVTRNALSAFQM